MNVNEAACLVRAINTDPLLTPKDGEALLRAARAYMERSQNHADRLRSKLARDPVAAAQYASVALQMIDAQCLPVAWAADDDNTRPSYLKKRLRELGLSIWEPFPASAIRSR